MIPLYIYIIIYILYIIYILNYILYIYYMIYIYIIYIPIIFPLYSHYVTIFVPQITYIPLKFPIGGCPPVQRPGMDRWLGQSHHARLPDGGPPCVAFSIHRHILEYPLVI
jgi:hypothetical protein